MRILLALVAFFSLAIPIFAQAERYELGQRLKRFEIAWEKQPDLEARKRALPLLPDITPMFFSLRFGDAGRTLDRARWMLANKDEPPLAEQWLEALYAVPEKRLIDKGDTLTVVVKSFFLVKTERPTNAKVMLKFDDGEAVEVPLAKLPVTVRLPFRIPEELLRKDCILRLETKLDDRTVTVRDCTVSLVHDFDKTMEKFRGGSLHEPPTLESATLRDRIEFLNDLKELPGETDFPVAAMIDEGHAMLAKERYFDRTRPGQFWLSIPLEKQKTQPVRLFVPKGLDAMKPVPIVIALHGAGGSENLFFEGYGAGHIVKECEKRGWLLVAPRSGFAFGSGPPMKAILDRLAERYPIDRAKVFVVGHSMGAAHTVAVCQEHAELFAGAAALGGGGRVKDAMHFEKLPFFIGVGEKDFALSGARALARALPHATMKEYTNIEHMLIVRAALPEVFAMWDTLSKK